MRKFEEVINEFAEIAVFGFGVRPNKRNNDSDDYIDYLG